MTFFGQPGMSFLHPDNPDNEASSQAGPSEEGTQFFHRSNDLLFVFTRSHPGTDGQITHVREIKLIKNFCTYWKSLVLRGFYFRDMRGSK